MLSGTRDMRKKEKYNVKVKVRGEMVWYGMVWYGKAK